MATEPIAAYVARESPLEIVVNFGLFAGRELTREDVDSLAETLTRDAHAATFFVGRRYEIAVDSAEVSSYEVRIELPWFVLPEDATERAAAVTAVLQTVDLWARSRAATPPAGPEDLLSRIVRE